MPTSRTTSARGWDFVDNDAVPEDDDGHGSHVAGTIAADAANEAGAVGVAPSAKVMALRVLGNEGEGVMSGVIAAFDYAGDHGVRIVNASIGGASDSQILRNVDRRASEHALRRRRRQQRHERRRHRSPARSHRPTSSAWAPPTGRPAGVLLQLRRLGRPVRARRRDPAPPRTRSVDGVRDDERHLDGRAARRRCGGRRPGRPARRVDVVPALLAAVLGRSPSRSSAASRSRAGA